MKSIYLALLLAAPVAIVSCENPADNTPAATVTDAVGKDAPPQVQEGTRYVFTPKSQVNFVGSKVTGSHNGGFKSFTGHFTIKDDEPIGDDHEVVIDMTSAYSDDEKLTGHLKSPDFFDVEKYPESKFEVTKIEKKTDKDYVVSGNFTLHGQTKNISFPATVTRTADQVMIYAKFNINRKDFGIVYAGKADDLIRDEVVIELKLEAAPAEA